MSQPKIKPIQRITESAVMLAVATVLSLIPLVKMPFGGTLTPFSMVPVMIIAFRYGTGWGMLTGFVYSLIQLLLGADSLSYATSFGAAVAIILLDYVVAFSVIGLSGIFKKQIKDPVSAACCGALLVCFLRYVCHVISGCTVWAGVSIPSSDGLVYSLAYNSAYMVPETILSVAAVCWLFSLLDFSGVELTHLVREKKSKLQTAFSSLCLLFVIAPITFDAISVFGAIQSEEGFDITLIGQANYTLIGIVTLVCAAVAVVFGMLAKKQSSAK